MVDSREIMALSGENDKDARGLEGIILRHSDLTTPELKWDGWLESPSNPNIQAPRSP